MTNDELPPVDPQDPKPGPPRPRTALWVRVLLFGSLALNLLIVGLIVGSLGKRAGGPAGFDGPRLRDVGLGPLVAVLPKDQQRELRSRLRDHTQDLRRNRQQMRQDLEAILVILRTEPFDQGALSEILEGQRETAMDRQGIGHRSLVEMLAAAPASERAELADRMERALSKAKRRNASASGN